MFRDAAAQGRAPPRRPLPVFTLIHGPPGASYCDVQVALRRQVTTARQPPQLACPPGTSDVQKAHRPQPIRSNGLPEILPPTSSLLPSHSSPPSPIPGGVPSHNQRLVQRYCESAAARACVRMGIQFGDERTGRAQFTWAFGHVDSRCGLRCICDRTVPVFRRSD